MRETLPPFVLDRLFSPLERSDAVDAARGRRFISGEHRPYICYGVNAVSFNIGAGLSLRSSLNGVGLPAAPLPGFLTLVEWGTMVYRIDRVPLMACDPASAGQPVPAFPVFTTAPFLVDLGASFVDVPPAQAKLEGLVLNLALAPADASNLQAAGLLVPPVLRDPSNRLNR